MTKIRTANQLQDWWDEDFAWRVKEISFIRLAVKPARCDAQITLIRAGVALLYAHWEGFVKDSANAYVNYLSCQKLQSSELRSCFVALSLKKSIRDVGSSGKAEVAIAGLEAIVAGLGGPAQLPMRGISAKSNLEAKVFQDIACWIGIDLARYEPRFRFVDSELVKRRHEIAHGSRSPLQLSGESFEELAEGVVELLRWFKTDLEEALSRKAFRRRAL